ncbi:MAG: helix-turn-helix transcriptional regulator, partial [Porticoccaceae bacterium]
YRDSPSLFTPFGDCSFMPSGRNAYVRGCRGKHRDITCLFDMSVLRPHIDWDWTPLELAACFDIRNINIRACMLRLAEEVAKPGYDSDSLVDALFKVLITELCRHFKSLRLHNPHQGGQLCERKLSLIETYIDQSLEKSIRLEDIASLFGMCSRHLARLFKNTTGLSLGAHIAQSRIKRAKLMLMDPHSRVKEIAYQCGFVSQSSFSQAFRKATGQTPSQFRARLQP